MKNFNTLYDLSPNLMNEIFYRFQIYLTEKTVFMFILDTQ